MRRVFFLQVLFRLVDLSAGRVLIGGVDIAQIGANKTLCDSNWVVAPF
jgi:hypothetical protein